MRLKEPMLLVDEPIDRQVVVEISDSSEESDDDEHQNNSTEIDSHSNNNSNNNHLSAKIDNNNIKNNSMLLSKKSLNVIENELYDIIEKVLKRDNVHQQLSYSHSILNTRVNYMMKDCLQMKQKLTILQKKTRKWDIELYSRSKFKIRHKKPLDLPSNNYTSSSNLYEQENFEEMVCILQIKLFYFKKLLSLLTLAIIYDFE